MKKQTKTGTEREYYRLHTDAVETLVGATEENTPVYSRAELEKYRSGKKKKRMPDALKAVLIKWWFYGAVCFFVFWGLGLYVQARLDLYFIAAVVLGMATDLLINHFLRFTEKLPGGSARWMMVTRRGAIGFFLNLLYGFLLLFLVITAYSAVNALLAYVFAGNAPVLGVEPVLFGLTCMGADMLCILFKRTLLHVVRDAGKKV
ncbi:MAG: hypothetical protein E7326_00075 [Clostridiales bacterium]|nr:hypothetical protein [Clostridiales bacterium]